MAIIQVPAELYFTNVEIWCDRVSSALRSPFTGKRQVRKLAYDLWGFSGDLMPLDPMKAGEVKAFLMELAGRVNSFRLPVPASKYPLSNYAGANGTVTAGQIGRSVTASGFTPNTPLLKRGDHFNVGDELKVCVASVASNGGGSATISFEPPLKRPTVNGAVLKIKEPFLLLASDDDKAARWTIKPPMRHAFKLEAMEAV